MQQIMICQYIYKYIVPLSFINYHYYTIMSIRGEWKIENNLHYYLDMVFKEDENSSFLKILRRT